MSFTNSEGENRLGKLAGFAGVSALIFNFIPILTYFSIVLAPIALIAGLIALRRLPRTMAIVGIVTGLIYVLAAVLLIWSSMDAMERAMETAEVEGEIL